MQLFTFSFRISTHIYNHHSPHCYALHKMIYYSYCDPRVNMPFLPAFLSAGDCHPSHAVTRGSPPLSPPPLRPPLATLLKLILSNVPDGDCIQSGPKSGTFHFVAVFLKITSKRVYINLR